MVEGIYHWYDLFLGLIYLTLILALGWVIVKVKYKGSDLGRYFLYGLSLKLIGCIGFVSIYSFYYKGGDTFRYFRNSLTLNQIISENPFLYFKYLFSSRVPYSVVAHLEGTTDMFGAESNFMVVRFASVFGLAGFESYLVASLCFALFSFIGVWCLYRTTTYLFPKYYNQLAWATLFYPSLLFWGSSMMKDSIVIGSLGFLVYATYHIFIRRKKIFINLCIAIPAVYILLNVKEYVIIAFAPALLIWVTFNTTNRLSAAQRAIVKPVLGIAILAILLLALPKLGDLTQRYALEQILSTAESTANYIQRTTKGDSVYSFGNVDYSLFGLVKIFPQAVAATLFRPYIFEVRNPVMLLSSIESTIMILFTIYVIIKIGFIRLVRSWLSNPFLLAAIVFSIVFAFAVGLSTFNFGALARYKIPCLPFYVLALLVPYLDYRNKLSQPLTNSK